MTCTANSTKLPTGATGVGIDGENGNHGGLSGRWVYNSSTSNNPSSTQFRFDNTASSLVTNLYISDTGKDSVDYDLFLDNLSNSSNYGYVTVYKEFDPTKFFIGKITGVTDNGTYHTVTVTYIAATNATIPTSIYANGDDIVMTFAPAGGDGTDGSDGANGTSVLYSDTTGYAITTGTVSTTTYPSFKYTMPADTLDTNGSFIEIDVRLSRGTVSASDSFTFFLYVGGNIISGIPTIINTNANQIVVKTRITRTAASGASNQYITTNSTTYSTSSVSLINSTAKQTIGAGLDFTNSIVIQPSVLRTAGTGTITINELIVTKYTK